VPEGGLTPPAPDHGAELSPADEALLRGRPPEQALAWCERVAGAHVTAVAPLRGGNSSAVHGLTLTDGRALVLRRFVRDDWLAEDSGAPAREVAALRIAERCPVPTPRLVAADPEGADAGEPAVLTTRLPGAVVWRPADLERFLQGLAALPAAVHATPVAPGDLPPYAPYPLLTREPPPWSRRPEVWARAFSLFETPPPAGPPVLLHRDFHPGNVLWTGPAVTGLVDWASAAIGPAAADVGHCRWNLARTLRPGAAGRFLELTGVAYHPYWDVAAALGGFDAEEVAAKPPAEEAFLAAALARV